MPSVPSTISWLQQNNTSCPSETSCRWRLTAPVPRMAASGRCGSRARWVSAGLWTGCSLFCVLFWHVPFVPGQELSRQTLILILSQLREGLTEAAWALLSQLPWFCICFTITSYSHLISSIRQLRWNYPYTLTGSRECFTVHIFSLSPSHIHDTCLTLFCLSLMFDDYRVEF